jgi:hypothetical protein
MVENMLGPNAARLAAAIQQFQYNNQTYANLDSMPPEARQAFERAMERLKALDHNQNGIPDMLEGAMGTWGQPAQPGAIVQPAALSQPVQPSPPMITPTSYSPSAMPSQAPVISGSVESSDRNLRLLLVGGGIIVLLAIVAVLLGLLVYSQYFTPR